MNVKSSAPRFEPELLNSIYSTCANGPASDISPVKMIRAKCGNISSADFAYGLGIEPGSYMAMEAAQGVLPAKPLLQLSKAVRIHPLDIYPPTPGDRPIDSNLLDALILLSNDTAISDEWKKRAKEVVRHEAGKTSAYIREQKKSFRYLLESMGRMEMKSNTLKNLNVGTAFYAIQPVKLNTEWGTSAAENIVIHDRCRDFRSLIGLSLNDLQIELETCLDDTLPLAPEQREALNREKKELVQDIKDTGRMMFGVKKQQGMIKLLRTALSDPHLSGKFPSPESFINHPDVKPFLKADIVNGCKVEGTDITIPLSDFAENFYNDIKKVIDITHQLSGKPDPESSKNAKAALENFMEWRRSDEATLQMRWLENFFRLHAGKDDFVMIIRSMETGFRGRPLPHL